MAGVTIGLKIASSLSVGHPAARAIEVGSRDAAIAVLRRWSSAWALGRVAGGRRSTAGRSAARISPCATIVTPPAPRQISPFNRRHLSSTAEPRGPPPRKERSESRPRGDGPSRSGDGPKRGANIGFAERVRDLVAAVRSLDEVRCADSAAVAYVSRGPLSNLAQGQRERVYASALRSLAKDHRDATRAAAMASAAESLRIPPSYFLFGPLVEVLSRRGDGASDRAWRHWHGRYLAARGPDGRANLNYWRSVAVAHLIRGELGEGREAIEAGLRDEGTHPSPREVEWDYARQLLVAALHAARLHAEAAARGGPSRGQLCPEEGGRPPADPAALVAAFATSARSVARSPSSDAAMAMLMDAMPAFIREHFALTPPRPPKKGAPPPAAVPAHSTPASLLAQTALLLHPPLAAAGLGARGLVLALQALSRGAEAEGAMHAARYLAEQAAGEAASDPALAFESARAVGLASLHRAFGNAARPRHADAEGRTDRAAAAAAARGALLKAAALVRTREEAARLLTQAAGALAVAPGEGAPEEAAGLGLELASALPASPEFEAERVEGLVELARLLLVARSPVEAGRVARAAPAAARSPAAAEPRGPFGEVTAVARLATDERAFHEALGRIQPGRGVVWSEIWFVARAAASADDGGTRARALEQLLEEHEAARSDFSPVVASALRIVASAPTTLLPPNVVQAFEQLAALYAERAGGRSAAEASTEGAAVGEAALSAVTRLARPWPLGLDRVPMAFALARACRAAGAPLPSAAVKEVVRGYFRTGDLAAAEDAAAELAAPPAAPQPPEPAEGAPRAAAAAARPRPHRDRTYTWEEHL